MTTTYWPTELRRMNGGAGLKVSFDDGATFDLAAEYLRVESPSAEVRGHSPSQRQLQFGKAAVRIADIVPVGNYAVRLVFDDGHSTGIYSWTYLRSLGDDHDARWTAYLKELTDSGLSR